MAPTTGISRTSKNQPERPRSWQRLTPTATATHAISKVNTVKPKPVIRVGRSKRAARVRKISPGTMAKDQ